MEHAKKVGPKLLDGKPVGGWDRLKYQLGNLLVYRAAEEHAGHEPRARGLHRGRGDRARDLRFLSGARDQPQAALRPDRGLGLHHAAARSRGAPDTVGVPSPGVEMRIDENGEVFYRSPGVFVEYYKNPESTASTKDAEGWVATGDAGFIEAGHRPSADHRPRQGRGQDGGRAAVCAEIRGEQAEVLPNILEAVVFGNGRECARPSSTST
jgi:long-chain acyl-CoA synthetase